MHPRLTRQINDLCAWIGADSWTLVRCRTHAVVEFHLAAGSIRQTFSTTPSDRRAGANARASLVREAGRATA